jgi:hypothetical protein
MTDDHIEKLRAHLERHKHRQQAFFSIDGLRALLKELEDVQAMFVMVEKENQALTMRATQLEAQVKGLIAKEGQRISTALKREYSK